MLGLGVSQAAVSRYLPPPSRRPSQSWRTFVRNQSIVFGRHQDREGQPDTEFSEPAHLVQLAQACAIGDADCGGVCWPLGRLGQPPPMLNARELVCDPLSATAA